MTTPAPAPAPAPAEAPASRVMAVPPAPSADAAAYFAARLAFHTDVADVHAALAAGATDFAVVDSRSTASWDQGHVPGAVHLPTAQIPQLARQFLDPAVPVVVHCWGPGCDGATRAALALARLGYRVKEMLGGIEYWIREGYAVETADGTRQLPPDPLTAPLGVDDCGC